MTTADFHDLQWPGAADRDLIDERADFAEQPVGFLKAAIRLAELPLVENPIKPSPCPANEINWRTKT
jgi:hypothetical protein